MNITQFVKLATTSIDHNTAILINGNHGIAKSAVCKIVGIIGAQQDAMMEGISVADLSKTQITPHGFVDRRLAIDEVPDLRGMMYNLGGRTVWATPDWFPLHDDEIASLTADMAAMGLKYHAPKFAECGVLLLDEIGQASPEVQKAAFELVLDRTLAGRRIAPGWRIMAANNGNTKLYGTATFSPAFMDRWFVVDLCPTFEELFEWGDCPEGENPQYIQDRFTPDTESPAYQRAAGALANRRNLYPVVKEYMSKFIEHIDMSDETIQVYGMNNRKGWSRRSWDKFSRSLYRAHDSFINGFLEYDILTPQAAGDLISLAAGHLGTVVALQFQDFVVKDGEIITAKVLREQWKNGESDDFKAKVLRTDTASMLAILDGVNKGIVDTLAKAKESDLGKPQYLDTTEFVISLIKFFEANECPAFAVHMFKTLSAEGQIASKLLAYEKSLGIYNEKNKAESLDQAIFRSMKRAKK